MSEDKPATQQSAATTARSFGGGRFSAGMPAEKTKDFRATVRRLARTMAPRRAAITVVLVSAIGGVTLSVMGPKLMGDATDVIVRGSFSPAGVDFGRLRDLLLATIGLYLGSSALQWLQSYLLANVVQRSMQDLRNQVEDKLNRLSLAYVDSQPRGDLLSRVTNDIDNLSTSLQQSLSQMLTSVLTVTGVLIAMFLIDWVLATIALVIVPISLLGVKAITRRSKGRFVAQWKHTGDLNSQVEEAFSGHALVKVFGRSEDIEATFAAKNDELYEAGFKAQFMAGLIQPMMMFLGNLNVVAIAVVGGLRVSSGQMTIGDIQAFIQYARRFTQPLAQLASMANVLQSGMASAERVFELLDVEEQSPDPDAPAAAATALGRVEFDGVWFSYDADKPLIEDLSLVAEPGQTIAIVGPTGAGKTTLVNLLMRFYEVDRGAIRLDGVDVAQLRRATLRANMGMVLQDTWLFGGTIRENIAYGNLDATDDQILEAARACYVDRFVHSLAGRLRLPVGRRQRRRQRRGEAAHHDRSRLPRGSHHPHPRRGDQLGRHPHRGADPTGHGGAAPGAHQLRHRPPPVDHPRRRHHPGDGERPHRRAGQPRRPAGRRGRVRAPLPGAVHRRSHRGRPHRDLSGANPALRNSAGCDGVE